MTKILVDGAEVDVPPEFTLLQACEQAGAEIPRFCYHERLSIAGNCRMCLVEVKGGPPKPQASCAMAVKDLRPGPKGEPPEIFTNTPMVKKAREGVMEFLLVNHPLDCPICDQGGECDLQDQAMAFGGDSSRYIENKRAVENKYIGPLVKTEMNRCIHCTRCVRFTAEVAGTGDMGAIGRGEDMEITTYLQTAMHGELQGNVADLCPVGALLPKPQNFRARPWEYQKTESVDVQDALGSAIRVDSRGREVMRILPRVNDAVNEEWISDKARQVVDGLKRQRLDRPFIRENGRLRPASWQEALNVVAAKTKEAPAARIGGLVGDLAAVEEIFALKTFLDGIGVINLDCRQDGARLDPTQGRGSYLFNPAIAGIDEACSLLIIGANPRKEAPVLNARIRRRWLKGNFKVSLVGEKVDLTYDYDYLGAGPQSLLHFIQNDKSGAKKRIVLVGQGALAREDGLAIRSLAAQAAQQLGGLNDGWNGFAVLHTAASRVGALDLGFVPAPHGLPAWDLVKAGALDLIFNLGADEIDIEPGAFVVYIGSHGDRGAHRADVILPGAAYTEKSGIFVNTEGRAQMASRAVFPPGEAREDWAIIRALSGAFGQPLPFDTLAQLRKALYAKHPHLQKLDKIEAGDSAAVATVAGLTGIAMSAPLATTVADFYLTNPIARASAVMAECSALTQGRLRQAAE
ncbi:MAG TPA: NADH-quinone oxidoreductase subunit NuoG [Methylocystis sp.]|nr:NADH-quinone oxidoreductase subunit NuoG [Methylocystis sp.]